MANQFNHSQHYAPKHQQQSHQQQQQQQQQTLNHNLSSVSGPGGSFNFSFSFSPPVPAQQPPAYAYGPGIPVQQQPLQPQPIPSAAAGSYQAPPAQQNTQVNAAPFVNTPFPPTGHHEGSPNNLPAPAAAAAEATATTSVANTNTTAALAPAAPAADPIASLLALPQTANPVCVVVLDASTLRPQKSNAAFGQVFGPIYKFSNWDFGSAAVADGGDGAKDADGDDATAESTPPSSQQGGNDADNEESKTSAGSNRSRFQSALRRVADGQSFTERVRNVEMLVLGEGLPVRKYFDWNVGSYGAGQGGASMGARQVVLYGNPVTPEEAKDRARDAELLDFFQNAPIALHWLSGEGIVLWANNTELNVLGYTAEEYIGQPIMKFCPDEQELVLEIFKQLGSGNSIRDVPVRFRTKEGKLVNLLIDSNVAYNKDGSFGHTRCFIRDDTGRKIRDARSALLLEETERSQRMMDGFLCRALHHVKTPLQALQGACDLVSDNLHREKEGLPTFIGSDSESGARSSFSEDTNEESIALLQAASRGINATVQMASDASDLARLDQGAMLKTSIRDVVLRDVGMKALLAAVDPEFANRVAVNLELVGGGPTVLHTDRKVLHRTLCHLLSNAVRETAAKFDKIPGHGTVTLRIKSRGSGVGNQGHSVTFEVEDNGPGLPQNSDGQDYGFQKYTGLLKLEGSSKSSDPSSKAKDDKKLQAARVKIEEQIRSRNRNGMGIGLPLSYHLAAAVGSDLRFSSKPGVGTKFWMAVPDNVEEAAMKAASADILTSETITLRSLVKEGMGKPSDDSSLTSSSASAGQFIDDDSEGGMAAVPAARIAECGVKATVQPSVLLVEDTAVSAKMITTQLRKIHCAVFWARNGKEAVDILRDSDPGMFDLVLMDLRMPVMDGFEATKVIREELALADLPIVALTGEAEGHTSDECLKGGFNGFKSKPIKRGELQALIENYVIKIKKENDDEGEDLSDPTNDPDDPNGDSLSNLDSSSPSNGSNRDDSNGGTSSSSSSKGGDTKSGGDINAKKCSDSKDTKEAGSAVEASLPSESTKSSASTVEAPDAKQVASPVKFTDGKDGISTVESKEKPCILVVEDTAMCAKVVMMMVKKLGCNVVWAKDGKEAVEKVQESPAGTFNMILMDLRMPIMDGFEATRCIRNDLHLPNVPIVALTGEAEDQTEQECAGAGFDEFQTKPLKRDKLKVLISKFALSA